MKDIDPNGLDWRDNGNLVFDTTPSLLNHIRTAEPASISLLEFSGHRTRFSVNVDPGDSTNLDNVMQVRADGSLILKHKGVTLDDDWIRYLKLALDKNARVFFSSCKTGQITEGGPASTFGSLVKGVPVIGSPHSTVGSGDFWARDTIFTALAKRDGRRQGITEGGFWNSFLGGKFIRGIKGKGPVPK